MQKQALLKYSDVGLIHKYGIVTSRKECDTSVEFGGRTFKLPIVPANMACVMNFKLAEWMSNNDYFYIMHRFETYDNIYSWIKNSQDTVKTISISVGIKEKDLKLIEAIKHFNLRVDFITIDVAFAFSEHVKTFVRKVQDILPNSFLIVGNMGTSESVIYFEQIGVYALKIGIGSGKVCTTALKTGFYTPMFSTVLECCKNVTQSYIIADGGIENNGDIAKALVAGADMVMAGNMFASCIDSPADNVFATHHVNGSYPIIGKQYYGSASSFNKGTNQNVEGTLIKIPCNGMTYQDKLQEIEMDLQSSISYAGGKDLTAFLNVDWFRV